MWKKLHHQTRSQAILGSAIWLSTLGFNTKNRMQTRKAFSFQKSFCYWAIFWQGIVREIGDGPSWILIPISFGWRSELRLMSLRTGFSRQRLCMSFEFKLWLASGRNPLRPLEKEDLNMTSQKRQPDLQLDTDLYYGPYGIAYGSTKFSGQLMSWISSYRWQSCTSSCLCISVLAFFSIVVPMFVLRWDALRFSLTISYTRMHLFGFGSFTPFFLLSSVANVTGNRTRGCQAPPRNAFFYRWAAKVGCIPKLVAEQQLDMSIDMCWRVRLLFVSFTGTGKDLRRSCSRLLAASFVSSDFLGECF